jgi:phage recombination protein Bet
MNDLTLTKTQPRNQSLIVRFADRYGIQANRVMDTLKATAFKTERQVSDEQMMALLIVAERHQLDPFTREIFAFPDKNGGITPVVSVDGWARIINEHPMMNGMEFEYDVDDRFITCVLYRKDRDHPIRVTEFLIECKRNTDPWNKSPKRMLRHKALIQCARLAFGFAGIYDEDEAARIRDMGPVDQVQPPSASADRVRAVLANVEVVPGPADDRSVSEDPPPPPPQASTDPTTGEILATGDEQLDQRITDPATLDNLLQTYQDLLLAQDNADSAAIVLDEARSILDDQRQAILGNLFTTTWPKE